MTLDGIAAIKAAHPTARLGMNENDLGMFEVWAKVDRVALGFASGWSVDEAFARLASRLGSGMGAVCPVCHQTIEREAHGGPHPSSGDHDPAFHVAATYGVTM